MTVRRWTLLTIAVVVAVAATMAPVGVGPLRADTAQIAEFPIPGVGAGELGPIATGFGATWFRHNKSDSDPAKIYKMDPDTGAILATFTGPTNGQGWLITGMGAVWYNHEQEDGGIGDTIGRLDPVSGVFTEFDLPDGDGPSRIATGFDHVWYTGIGHNVIGRLDPSTGVVTEFAIPTANAIPVGITTGLGFVWFAEAGGNRVGRLDPDTGVITEFPMSVGGFTCCGVTTGFGAVWYTASRANVVGRLDPGTGNVTEYLIPNSRPVDIIAGPHGSVWFTEMDGNNIGRLDPVTGAITEYAVPTPGSVPLGIADGSIWFTESNAATIGRLRVSDRLAGPNRFATAAAISASEFDPGVPAAYLATGGNFPDALAGGPVAALNGGPILLLSSIPGATAAELTRLQPQKNVLLALVLARNLPTSRIQETAKKQDAEDPAH